MRPLFRLAVWGACAIIATGAAVLAGRSEPGSARASAALAAFRASPMEFLSQASGLDAQATEEQQLAETVQTLTADRDRLAAQVATLERSLSDLTGSIARERAPSAKAAGNNPAAPPEGDKPDLSASAALQPPAPDVAGAAPAAPPEIATALEGTRPGEPPKATLGTVVSAPARTGPPGSVQSYVSSASTTRPASRLAAAPASPEATASVPPPLPRGTAVELAMATNINALRARWGALKTAQPTLLGGLKPLVATRTNAARPGVTEFHLVAGPVADHDSAARLCAALASSQISCRPTPYSGQSLELR